MDLLYIISGIIAIGLLIYLIITLFFPEKF
jgi:K+-transporting ATPase KdpF subunit